MSRRVGLSLQLRYCNEPLFRILLHCAGFFQCPHIKATASFPDTVFLSCVISLKRNYISPLFVVMDIQLSKSVLCGLVATV